MDWILLVVSLLLLCIGVTLLYLYVFPPCVEGYVFSNTTPRVSVSDVLSQVKTGDLILLSGTSRGERLIRAVTRSPYSHVAMVVVENGTPYLWESDVGQRVKDGVRVIELREKLSLYKGEKIGLWLKFKDETKRPSRESIVALLNKYLDMKIPKCMEYYLFSSSPSSYFYKESKEEDAMYCSELVAQTLQDLEVLDKNHVAGWYAPKTFLELGELYHEPRLFDFKDVKSIDK